MTSDKNEKTSGKAPARDQKANGENYGARMKAALKKRKHETTHRSHKKKKH
jgi:hypothetical protein